MKTAANNRKQAKLEEDEAQDVHTEPNECELGDDDLRTSPNQQVTHPTTPVGPHIIEDDSAPNYHRTRRSRREALLSAVEISNSCPTAAQAARRKYPMTFLCDFAGSVLDKETGELLEYRHLIKHPKMKDDWRYSFGNEIGRLAQGMPGRNHGTNTIFFIDKSTIPAEKWKDVAYSRIVCNVRPKKRRSIGPDSHLGATTCL